MIAGIALGALAGLDRTAFGQTLLAHPFVTACVSGTLAGDPVRGLQAGVLLWMLSAPRVPVGETRIRDWTTAAVVLPWVGRAGEGDAAWTVALAWSVVVALVGGVAITGVREIARRSLDAWRSLPVADRSDPVRLHVRLTALHAARGAMLSAAAIVIGTWVVEPLLATAGAGLARVLEHIWALAPVALLPLLWRVHGDLGRGRLQWSLMAAGAVAAFLVGRSTGGSLG